MPKTKQIESVVHDWVHGLTFQMQALLMTTVRGPDGNKKHNTAKSIIRYFRGSVIKAAGKWYGKNDNDFMWGEYSRFHNYVKAFWDDHDEYPHHFIMHLVHCAEVLGYYHPDSDVRHHWHIFYLKACESFHMHPEEKHQMDRRLNDFGHAFVPTTH
jgi:hypothetical protein